MMPNEPELPKPQEIDTGARCCPKCGSTTFLFAGCRISQQQLAGHRLQCKGCNWQGPMLHLVKRPGADVGPMPDLAAELAAQAAASVQEPEP